LYGSIDLTPAADPLKGLKPQLAMIRNFIRHFVAALHHAVLPPDAQLLPLGQVRGDTS